MKKSLFIGLLTYFLLACSFAPKIQRPVMPVPQQYKETAHWKKARGTEALKEDTRWWIMYGDPVLDALEARVDCANQNLQVAFARYQKARALAEVASSALVPSVYGIGNADRQKTSRNAPNPTRHSTFGDLWLGLHLNYELDLWGRVRNSVAASASNAQATAADLAAVSLSLHAELALRYFALRGNEALQQVLDATVKAYQRALYIVKKRHEGGASPIADVDEAITLLENAKTRATQLRLEHAQLEHAIAVLVGEIPANFTMPPAKVRMKPVAIAQGLPSALLERRPDIIAAEQRVQSANYQIGVATAAFYPQITLTGLLGFESASLGNLISKPSLFWSIGPPTALAIIKPLTNLMLFDGGNLQGLLNKAKAGYYETVAGYRQTVLTAFQEVEDSLVAIYRLDQENRSQTAATAAAKRALKQALDRYYGGITNYLDVIVNENIALESEVQSVTILTRRQLASVQLIKALGGGWSCHNKCV
ncbi:MAG: efflux transporter outer membrane subunit [Tatlockia sp.]|jgi:NodT family efflux transporter outer membrane factor (OMF) lipoprotein